MRKIIAVLTLSAIVLSLVLIISTGELTEAGETPLGKLSRMYPMPEFATTKVEDIAEYALFGENVKVIASSQYTDPTVPETYFCTNILNDDDLYWVSDYDSAPIPPHWIIIEFESPKTVSGVFIKHHVLPEAATSDYRIQTWSDEEGKWYDQVLVLSNEEPETHHIFKESVTTSKVALYVISANKGASNSPSACARIRYIQIIE